MMTSDETWLEQVDTYQTLADFKEINLRHVREYSPAWLQLVKDREELVYEAIHCLMRNFQWAPKSETM